MNNNRILAVLEAYEKHFINKGAENIKADFDEIPTSHQETWNHLLSMIGEMKVFLKQNRREKLFRWLDFMQGVLWTTGEFTLNQFRRHNQAK